MRKTLKNIFATALLLLLTDNVWAQTSESAAATSVVNQFDLSTNQITSANKDLVEWYGPTAEMRHVRVIENSSPVNWYCPGGQEGDKLEGPVTWLVRGSRLEFTAREGCTIDRVEIDATYNGYAEDLVRKCIWTNANESLCFIDEKVVAQAVENATSMSVYIDWESDIYRLYVTGVRVYTSGELTEPVAEPTITTGFRYGEKVLIMSCETEGAYVKFRRDNYDDIERADNGPVRFYKTTTFRAFSTLEKNGKTYHSATKIVTYDPENCEFFLTLGDTGEKVEFIEEDNVHYGFYLPNRTPNDPSHTFVGWVADKLTSEVAKAPAFYSGDTYVYEIAESTTLYPLYMKQSSNPIWELLPLSDLDIKAPSEIYAILAPDGRAFASLSNTVGFGEPSTDAFVFGPDGIATSVPSSFMEFTATSKVDITVSKYCLMFTNNGNKLQSYGGLLRWNASYYCGWYYLQDNLAYTSNDVFLRFYNGQFGIFGSDTGDPIQLAIKLSKAYYTVNGPNSFDLTIGSTSYATMYLDYAVEIPEGVKAFTASVTNGEAVLTQIEDVIPANTGVLLYGAPSTYSFIQTATDKVISDNDLTGWTTDTDITGSNEIGYYALNVGEDGEVGFFAPKGAGNPNGSFTAKAYKAYLKVQGALAGSLSIRVDGGTLVEPMLQKSEGSNVYDLQGRRVLNAEKGIYIVNGKKVLVK